MNNKIQKQLTAIFWSYGLDEDCIEDMVNEEGGGKKGYKILNSLIKEIAKLKTV